MPRSPQRAQAYRECLKEHEALKEIAHVIVRYLPGDFELTREEAVNEIIGILETTEIFEELPADNTQAAE